MRATSLFFFSGNTWVILGSVCDALVSWKGFLDGKKLKKVLQAGSLGLLWMVWKTRNKIVFKDEVLSMQSVFLL